MTQRFTNKKNMNKGFTLLELGICIGIIAILAAMAQPNICRRGPRYDPKQKACFSNQRVLQGAIEMYNMDNSVMIETALPGGDYTDFEELLIREKYLKDYLELPTDECSYGFIDIVGTGTVFCKKHGTIESKVDEKPIIPEYDTSYERPISYSYRETRINKRKEKEFRDTMKTLNNIIVSPPFIIILGIFVLAYSLTSSGKKTVKPQ